MRALSAMFADLDTDPEIWPKVKTKLNCMIGEADPTLVHARSAHAQYRVPGGDRTRGGGCQEGAHATRGGGARKEHALRMEKEPVKERELGAGQ